MNAFFEDLKRRGLVAQTTHETLIQTQLDEGVTLYCGFDPTADSLHVGSLLPLVTLLRFKQAGHRVLPLIGGATGMIGDPSFKAQERALNTEETVNHFKSCIHKQISGILGSEVEVVDNHEWTSGMSVIEFLRDVGKHFSVNTMIARDSVRSRLERPDQGISFTEFSYQLLQSMDFWKLLNSHGCTMQLGGSDQWGNITAGIDLIHKKEGNDKVATGITMPLVTKSDGTKFGKTESGAVWLSADKTSPFQFFQFWLSVSDSDIERLFKFFSFRSVDEIDTIIAEDKARGKPLAQRLLAEELTLLVHGQKGLDSALALTDALFLGDVENLDKEGFEMLEKEGMPAFETATLHLVELLVETKLASSKRQAREFIQGGAVSINGRKVVVDASTDLLTLYIEREQVKFERFLVLQRGKKNFALLKFKEVD